MLKLWQWLKDNGGPIVVACTLIGGAYAVGLKQGENNLAEVEQFKKILPGMMANLQKLSGDLALSAGLAEENKKLKEQATADTAQVGELQTKINVNAEQLRSVQDENNKLQDELNKLVPTSTLNVTINVASAKQVIPNGLTIGVQTAYPGSGYVRATVNSYNGSWTVGESQSFEIAGKSCKVELMQIGATDTNWSIACTNK